MNSVECSVSLARFIGCACLHNNLQQPLRVYMAARKHVPVQLGYRLFLRISRNGNIIDNLKIEILGNYSFRNVIYSDVL